MSETTITKDQLTTTANGNQIIISLDSKREQLPQPTTAETALGDVIFGSLLCTFCSSLVTQIILYLPLPELTSVRLLSSVVGLSLFGAGLQWTLSKRLQPTTVINLSSVFAGVVLGS
ncbi:hypothetical protein [Nostoc cycadae]|uniref:PAS/PAC and GAF sensor-containing diguanylate cyclase/phosphodiesterase n=1 Tax=Nostoc cycadae WK-1 TaxID=1861711 RepID=A0A2H6LC86_9NOSO|nr:hypothetical protein [Nostoc cycadae]GBE90841.1 PAS/PAC and GAF sensor-containing diguanylate cyclase/phosphodiesterase [Nostoc cycadae WK-1]